MFDVLWLIYTEFKANSTVNRAWMRIIYMGHQSLFLGNTESFGKLCLEHFKWQNYQETAVIDTIPINRPQRITGDSCRYGAVVDDLPTSYKTLSLITIMEKIRITRITTQKSRVTYDRGQMAEGSLTTHENILMRRQNFHYLCAGLWMIKYDINIDLGSQKQMNLRIQYLSI